MNYQVVLDETLKNLQGVPKLLLHACCAPCSSYVIEYLSNYFEITVFFYNSNMDSKEEYDKRLNELKRFIKVFKTKYPVKVVNKEYNHQEFLELARGLEKEPERGRRCLKCYEKRLLESFLYAKENHFDYVTTTLTLSPLKNSRVINEIAQKLEKELNFPYLYSDFKKRDGYKRSIVLSKEYHLYRQDYCGCEFSKKDYSNESLKHVYENTKILETKIQKIDEP